jgi:hypothetical protein
MGRIWMQANRYRVVFGRGDLSLSDPIPQFEREVGQLLVEG